MVKVGVDDSHKGRRPVGLRILDISDLVAPGNERRQAEEWKKGETNRGLLKERTWSTVLEMNVAVTVHDV